MKRLLLFLSIAATFGFTTPNSVLTSYGASSSHFPDIGVHEVYIAVMYDIDLTETYYVNMKVRYATLKGYEDRYYHFINNPFTSPSPWYFDVSFPIMPSWNVFSYELISYGPYAGN